MRGTALNGDNGGMKRAVTVLATTAAAALAACGGGGGGANIASTLPAKQAPKGGVVQADGTAGLLGPATTVDPNGAKTVGKTAPISPKENRPTDAQSHGVAGGVACSSTSADPAPTNLSAI